MGGLKEALKKTKSGKSLGEVTWILNCINMQKTHFMGDYCFLNNIYMMGEMPEEWKNYIILHIYKKGDKQKVENYRRISWLNLLAPELFF